MPNSTGAAVAFPQILSVPPTPPSTDAGAAATAAAKAAVRRRVRADRSRRPPGRRHDDALALAGLALEQPEVAPGGCVALFASTGTEPGTGPLREELRRRGVEVLLPLVRAGRLEWARDAGTRLRPVPGPGGPEPVGPSLGAGGLLLADVVLAPALAVDTLGTRLGQGGGYYDAALPLLPPGVPVLAVVHEEEVLDAAVEPLPSQGRDVPVDGALTPCRCLRLPGRGVTAPPRA